MDAGWSAADVAVELVGRDGAAARLPLSHFAPLRPMPPTQVLKVPALAGVLGLDLQGERLLQTYDLPLAEFVRAHPAFDPASLSAVRLRFDGRSGGALLLDNVGFNPAP